MPETSGIASARDLAQHYATRHLKTDTGVDRVYFLPTNAPPREIRILEVNRMISESTPLEPIDFGVDIGSENAHTLYVLDVTPSQWDAIERGEMELPAGWVLDDQGLEFGRDRDGVYRRGYGS